LDLYLGNTYLNITFYIYIRHLYVPAVCRVAMLYVLKRVPPPLNGIAHRFYTAVRRNNWALSAACRDFRKRKHVSGPRH